MIFIHIHIYINVVVRKGFEEKYEQELKNFFGKDFMDRFDLILVVYDENYIKNGKKIGIKITKKL